MTRWYATASNLFQFSGCELPYLGGWLGTIYAPRQSLNLPVGIVNRISRPDCEHAPAFYGRTGSWLFCQTSSLPTCIASFSSYFVPSSGII